MTQRSLELDKELSKVDGILIKIISMKIQELFPFASLAQCGKTRNLHSTQKYFVKSTCYVSNFSSKNVDFTKFMQRKRVNKFPHCVLLKLD